MEEDVYIARLQMPEIRTLNPKRNQKDEHRRPTRPGHDGMGIFCVDRPTTDDRQCDLSWRRNIFRTWLNWKRRRRRHRAAMGGKGDMHILWHCGIYISGCPSSGLYIFFFFARQGARRENRRGQKVCDLLQVRLSEKKKYEFSELPRRTKGSVPLSSISEIHFLLPICWNKSIYVYKCYIYPYFYPHFMFETPIGKSTITI